MHFFSGDSFHLRCLGETETENPLVAADNRKVLEIRRNLAESSSQHETFVKQVCKVYFSCLSRSLYEKRETGLEDARLL